MINTWVELLAEFKKWWNTPLKWERKVKQELEYKWEDLMRPPKYQDPFEDLNRYNRKRFSNEYFEDLRRRVKRGEHLTQDELYRLKMDRHIRELNDSLEETSKELDNLNDKLPPCDGANG